MSASEPFDGSTLHRWGDDRRFYSYTHYLRERFGQRLLKIPIDAGFTCPNRDGTKGKGGCTYCLNEAFNPSYCTRTRSVTEQLEAGKAFYRRRNRKDEGVLAYFQAYSNTYAPVSRLRALHEEALRAANVRGIVIATRPDCLCEEVLDYLQELSKKTYLCIEIGIESCRDETLRHIHRGHDFLCTRHAIEQLDARGIGCGGHLIFGLPKENPGMWMEDIRLINALPLQMLKFHQLQIIRGTDIEKEYLARPDIFHILSFDSYIDFITTYIERLRPDIAIERMAGAVPARYPATAGWQGIRYDAVVKSVEQRLLERDTHQGAAFAAGT